jgi:serine/threonine protein kinase
MLFCGAVVSVKFMHSPGIVYRDLRPASILIDSKRRIQLEDLGTSKFNENTIRLSGNYQGMVQYQALELYDEVSSPKKSMFSHLPSFYLKFSSVVQFTFQTI